MIKYICLFAFIICCMPAMAQQDTAKALAIIEKATVYFGNGAELTHQAKVSLSTNTKYIVIDKVSTQIDLNSLQISCPEYVSLLAQQFSIYYPQPKPKPTILLPTVIKIMDSIKRANKDVALLRNKISIEETTLAKANSLIEATIQTSGSKTTLTADVLKLVEFNMATIEKNKNTIFKYQQDVELVQANIAALQEHLALLNNTANYEPQVVEQPYGRIIMQVVCNADALANIALSYYSSQAGWQPIYDLRVNSKTNTLKLIYKASLIQNTGIDWINTKLTLSTGTPNFTATAPILSTWYLKYFMPQLYQSLSRVATNGYGKQSTFNAVQSFTDKDFKKIEVNSNQSDAARETIQPSTLEQYTTLVSGLLNTNFEIDLPYNITSNGQAHSITIKAQEVQSILKNYAVPKLDIDAYLLAEITNWQNLELLPGNANIIMDDTYIGKSFIDPNSTADTLNLSLGKDKRITVKRSILKDATLLKTKDGFTKQSFTYELTVKNNKTKEVNILLKDQYPLSNEKDISIELVKDGDAAINTDLGVLTWKIKLQPGESQKVSYTYTVKYPKDKKIANFY